MLDRRAVDTIAWRDRARACAACAAVALAVAAPAPVLADDKGGEPAAVAVGAGLYDAVRRRTTAEMLNLEYRSDKHLWWFTPQAGAWATNDGSFYTYAGVRMDVFFGNRVVFTPSFAPGFYFRGSGRDLGYVIEFRSSAELAYRFDDYSRLGLGIAHLSNASLGGDGRGLLLPGEPKRNPGVETLTLSYSMPINAPERAVEGGAGAGPCCTGFYSTAVAVAGGAFLSGAKSTTGGTVKDTSAKDSVAGGGLAIGYNWLRFGLPIRTELEYAHIVRFDYDSRPAFKDKLPQAGFSDNVNTTTILGTVLYDINVGYSWWRPYVGVSVGLAHNHSDNAWNDFSKGTASAQYEQFNVDNLAWAASAGASYDFTDNWFAEAGYRYLHTGKIETGFTAAGVRIEADTSYRHELRLGFGYRF